MNSFDHSIVRHFVPLVYFVLFKRIVLDMHIHINTYYMDFLCGNCLHYAFCGLDGFSCQLSKHPNIFCSWEQGSLECSFRVMLCKERKDGKTLPFCCFPPFLPVFSHLFFACALLYISLLQSPRHLK
eukprot:TRINITY_DN76319_c0_g1_i1.p1 TRINITY_DN76319_c0_g1~~TRINITY_DN76319_c0_g1_i1.p1  ORF type:complete len:127 (+),score=19.77 TRINITY_DN76319_c0_g1_i1:115-495(+)